VARKWYSLVAEACRTPVGNPVLVVEPTSHHRYMTTGTSQARYL